MARRSGKNRDSTGAPHSAIRLSQIRHGHADNAQTRPWYPDNACAKTFTCARPPGPGRVARRATRSVFVFLVSSWYYHNTPVILFAKGPTTQYFGNGERLVASGKFRLLPAIHGVGCPIRSPLVNFAPSVRIPTKDPCRARPIHGFGQTLPA